MYFLISCFFVGVIKKHSEKANLIRNRPSIVQQFWSWLRCSYVLHFQGVNIFNRGSTEIHPLSHMDAVRIHLEWQGERQR